VVVEGKTADKQEAMEISGKPQSQINLLFSFTLTLLKIHKGRLW
jgi:hypothetical protein